MTVNKFSASVPIEDARVGLDLVRADHEVVLGFPDDVLAEADAAIAAHVLPERDLTGLEFVTLDPASSTDLDQAFFLERKGSGFRVRYAIADVPAFVVMGGAIDAETRRRGETVYCPDLKVSLHPPALADDAASLLPDQVRGAYVWSVDVDAAGAATFTGLERATIRSRAKLGYELEQQRLDEGSPHPQVALLREVGILRQQQEVARGAVSLPNLEQEVGADEGGGFTLDYRVSLPVEDWNAQLSLMTGMAAAAIMLDGGTGILRTMPAADEADLRRVRASARALGIRWPQEMAYPELIRTLDATNPQHAAFLDNVTMLLRGAGYTAFDGQRPGADDPLGDRRRVRAHDGAAAAARGQVRAFGLPGAGGGARDRPADARGPAADPGPDDRRDPSVARGGA